MEKYVVASVEERLQTWRAAEQAAQQAEQAVANIGQAASDPRIGQMLSDAKRLREEADRQFAAILRSVKMDSSIWGESANDQSGQERDEL